MRRPDFARSRLRGPLKRISRLLPVLLLLGGASWLSLPGNAATGRGLLADYALDGQRQILEGMDRNASGITYHPGRDSLFVIRNTPATLFEYRRDGQLLRQIALQGFTDTEGIAYIDHDRFAIVEESIATLTLITIGPSSEQVRKQDGRSLSLALQPGGMGNTGLEGVAVDVKQDLIYLVKEKSPRAVYAVRGMLRSGSSLQLSSPWDLQREASGMDDVSEVAIAPGSGNLLMLSDESSLIAEFLPSGTRVASTPLRNPGGIWPRGLPQAEGMAFDPQGTLYVVSEPNLLYRFPPAAMQLASAPP